MLIFAASTQRSIGLVIAVLVAVGVAGYVLFNIFTGRKEIGAEIELAPNRKPYYDDEELETRRLDRALAMGVGTLALISLALPLYWLGEPGRQTGRVVDTDRQLANRGDGIFEEQCSSCHGEGGVGGQAAYTVLDENGRFITSTSWNAPALDTVLYRFDNDEVTHILNYGRPQSPMPAWGLPGGGPLTEQQLEEIVLYLERIQLSPDQMTEQVRAGLRGDIVAGVLDDNNDAFTVSVNSDANPADVEAAQGQLTAAFNALVPGLGDARAAAAAISADPEASVDDILAAQDALTGLLDSYIDEIAATNIEGYGEMLFNNSAGAGAYGCARCHTAGASWDADGVLLANPALTGLVPEEVSGGGGFGPSLLGVTTQFGSPASQESFISVGCTASAPTYGLNGVCEPSGQMPGFGPDATSFAPVGSVGAVHQMLSDEQIAAIVAYERGLE